MRTLFVLLATLLCCSALSAQQRIVTFELEDGTVIVGPVVEIDRSKMVVEVGGERRIYRTEEVHSPRFQTVGVEEQDPAVAPAPLGETAIGPSEAKGTESKAPPARARQPLREVVYRTVWDRRKAELDQHYPWLFPTEAYQWVSLFAMLFALLSLAAHLAARLASPDPIAFGRAMTFAFLVLMGGAAQMAFVPATAPAVAVSVGCSGLLIVLLHRLCYSLSFGGALVASLLLTVECSIGYGLLELLDSTLRSIGSPGAA